MWSLDAEKNSSSSSSEDEADKEDESEGVSHSPAVLKGKESQLPHFSSLDKLERPKYLKQSMPQPLQEFSLQTGAPHEKKEGMKKDEDEVSLLEKKVFLQEIELQTKLMKEKQEKETLLSKNKKSAAGAVQETAKDRVKRQRLSGQSGIGSDFKEWKSEEAMRQRQQYD